MSDTTPGIYENGIFRKGDVRISDLAGRRRLPIGNSNFLTVVENSVFIDKTMLIADVLDGDPLVTLFCRPRRFGKSLNLDMLQRFLEIPSECDPSAGDTTSLFSRLTIWDAENGLYRDHHQAYPVIRLSFNDIKELAWDNVTALVAENVAKEYMRHGYLAESGRLNEAEKAQFAEIASRQPSMSALKTSLKTLAQLLYRHHGRRAVILVDEYDAPIMAGSTYGYYDEVVGFVKGWLTGALKDNDALAFACLTGVQRISKESIFSDLNNLTVNTSLNVVSEERYGFTQAEVDALCEYLRCSEAVEEARAWYDGYRFGSVDVYNPWSLLNYLSNGCVPDIYWGNTSGNSVLGEMIRGADDGMWSKLYALMTPGGSVNETLDLSVAFPDMGVRPDALWSMLYLAGYLTTNDTAFPNSTRKRRALRVPNAEIRELYRAEIVERLSTAAGSSERLDALHMALIAGDAEGVQEELGRILLNSASYFDLTRENSYHMLMLGLLFGMPGYEDPASNREAGRGRFDVLVEPRDRSAGVPVAVELKYVRPGAEADAPADALETLAAEALSQVGERAYAPGARAWGIAFSGKSCAVACR